MIIVNEAWINEREGIKNSLKWNDLIQSGNVASK
jgi:hypothetical protein